jgi:SAM-dependent methyltransferase
VNTSILRLLRCPSCGGSFTVVIDAAASGLEYDVLRCYCSEYPIVAGIPILKKGIVGDAGPDADDLISLIKAGRQREALLSVIAPRSPTLAAEWLRSLPSVKGVRRLKRLSHRRALREWSNRAANVSANRESMTACDALKFHFPEFYDYHVYRFGQPRHLVALSLSTLVRDPGKPILDLACGCGQLTFSLIQRANGQPVIAVDQFFVGLYVARHWIAPEAAHVCCAADTALPFADGTFAVAFCSDAFHYFANKALSFRELERLTRNDGLIVLVWMHNARAGKETPNDLPLLPEAYDALAGGLPHCLVGDSAVLSRYLQKRGPSLSRTNTVDGLADEPRVSMVASHREAIFRDYGTFEDWPHARGHLTLNPLFVREATNGNGDMLLRRLYPSADFEKGHAESQRYLPETVRISAEACANLERGVRTMEIEPLIEQCVVLGMPRQYL